jgi:hypothetical protein
MTHILLTKVGYTKLRALTVPTNPSVNDLGLFEVVETSDQFLKGEQRAIAMYDPDLYHRLEVPC